MDMVLLFCQFKNLARNLTDQVPIT